MTRFPFGFPFGSPSGSRFAFGALLASLGALAGLGGLACGAGGQRPNLPPPEYEEGPASAGAAGSMPLADADAAVDVARRQVDE
jgi:hypothetical protein